MTKCAFLGTRGPLSTDVLSALVQATDLVFLGIPARPSRATRRPQWRLAPILARLSSGLGLRRRRTVESCARRAGVRPLAVDKSDHTGWHSRLAAARPDLLVVAGFPWILPPEVLAIPRIGAVNVHAALLPRHRGPLPLFWVYHANDRLTGVTAHWMTQHVDAGDIITQSSFALPRGYPVDQLNVLNGEVAGRLVARILPSLIAGDASRQEQDEGAATAAPFVNAGAQMVDFESWDVERVWHFLAGLHPRFVEPIQSENGEPVWYRAVKGFTSRTPAAPPGTVVGRGLHRELACLGGHVQLRI